MNDVRNVIKQLNAGIIPTQLNFSKTNFQEEIDWNMVKYNSFYKSFEYTASKFPSGFESIPGFDKVIAMNIPKYTPLEEIERLKNNIEIIQGDE